MSIFATMFRRPPADTHQTARAASEMRGRAAEITDAGTLGWEVVWEALKTEPPADESSTITQELGLDHEQEIWGSYNSDRPGTEFSGMRHGREVSLRMGVVPGLRGKPYNEVHLSCSVAPFRIRAKDGRLVAEPGAPAEVEELLAGLQSSEMWRQLEVEAGLGEIVARRPVTMRGNPQGYVYDLWLLERVADHLAARSVA